jgi:hypothetical protein
LHLSENEKSGFEEGLMAYGVAPPMVADIPEVWRERHAEE